MQRRDAPMATWCACAARWLFRRICRSCCPDPVFGENVRDLIVHRRFRTDYWRKGARKLDGNKQIAAWRAQRIMLIRPRASVKLEYTSRTGQFALVEKVYQPVLALLADYQPRSLGSIEAALSN